MPSTRASSSSDGPTLTNMLRSLLLAAAAASMAPLLAHAEAAAPKKPVQVFILAGQSNMVGAGVVPSNPDRNGGKGSLEYLVTAKESKKRWSHLVDRKGGWAPREDVWINYFDRHGELTPGYGGNEDQIGPELGFGHAVGEGCDEQVLLVKVAWGGKSIGKDFRPPSAGGEVGPEYTKLFEEIRSALASLEERFEGYKGQGFELAGIGWHQGWNDRVNQAFNDEYEKNLACFIRDARKELEAPDLPFVIAETGMSGKEEKHPRALSLMRAQAKVATYPEFKGNVAFVGTRDFYRPGEESPSNQAYHWNSNAETYLLIGEGMGEAMLELLPRYRKKRAKAARRR